MNLEQLGKRDRQLESLLRQSQQWRKLDGEVKRIMPANPASAFSDGLCGRREAGIAGGEQYGCFKVENDFARAIAATAKIQGGY